MMVADALPRPISLRRYSTRLNRQVEYAESHEFATNVRQIADAMHRGIPAIEVGPAHEYEHRSATLIYLADRRLRQLENGGPTDDAA